MKKALVLLLAAAIPLLPRDPLNSRIGHTDPSKYTRSRSRTSVLKGTVGAPCRRGHSHAIYNPSDHPVEFMNINVAEVKNKYDAFNLIIGRRAIPARTTTTMSAAATICTRAPCWRWTPRQAIQSRRTTCATKRTKITHEHAVQRLNRIIFIISLLTKRRF
jgi:hypothetical protein